VQCNTFFCRFQDVLLGEDGKPIEEENFWENVIVVTTEPAA
jgi:hypothetical protein